MYRAIGFAYREHIYIGRRNALPRQAALISARSERARRYSAHLAIIVDHSIYRIKSDAIIKVQFHKYANFEFF